MRRVRNEFRRPLTNAECHHWSWLCCIIQQTDETCSKSDNAVYRLDEIGFHYDVRLSFLYGNFLNGNSANPAVRGFVTQISCFVHSPAKQTMQQCDCHVIAARSQQTI